MKLLTLRLRKLVSSDRTIEAFTGEECKYSATPVYKMVDTCAAEFDAETPYFYSTFDEENEAEEIY